MLFFSFTLHTKTHTRIDEKRLYGQTVADVWKRNLKREQLRIRKNHSIRGRFLAKRRAENKKVDRSQSIYNLRFEKQTIN